jgi:hypothetical protein
MPLLFGENVHVTYSPKKKISTISTPGMNQGVVVMPGGGGFIVWMSTNTMDTHGFVFLGVQGTIYSLGWRALPGDCAE